MNQAEKAQGTSRSMWSQIKQIWKLIGEYKRASLVTPLLAVAGTGFETLTPLAVAAMIDRGIEMGDLEQIKIYAFWAIVLSLLALAASVAAAVTAARAGAGLARNLRRAMFDQVQEFSFHDIDKFSSASLITRMTSDVNSIQNSFSYQ